MIELPTQSGAGGVADLVSRCRSLGVGLLSCGVDGEGLKAEWLPADPLVRSLANSGLLAEFVRSGVGRWGGGGELVEAWPGCLIAPMPERRGRRIVGMRLGLLVTAELVESDQFHHICRDAGLDDELIVRQLKRHVVYSPDHAAGIGRSLCWMARDVDGVAVKEGEITKLTTQLGSAYEELSLTYRLSAQMTLSSEPELFLREACEGLCEVLGLRWVAVRLSSDDSRLEEMGGCVVNGRCDGKGMDDDRLGGLMRVLSDRYAGGDSVVIDDAGTIGEGVGELAGALMVVPVSQGGRVSAVLVGASEVSDRELTTVDVKLATSTAQNMAIYLENYMLFKDLENMFTGALRSLIRSIDAKDAYTRGHSERVAYLSRQLAIRAGLDAVTVERVYLSGLLHDVGKIGVPEAVLTKAGRLTDDEFETIKAHPAIGAKILRDIRQMADLIPGVLYHHERYDGRGYPEGLTGEYIPLFGRLICLADSFDAMSSDRTYRRAMPLEKVLSEVTRCSGTQFDPVLADLFVGLNFERYFEMLAEHRERKAPLDEVRNERCEAYELEDGLDRPLPASIARL